MSNDPVDGGTVTYHRAEYDAEGKRNSDCVWLVWFTDDPTRFRGFTAEEGEAMGLTPPDPAPLVVTCNGHRIELSDEEAEWYATDWEGTVDRSPHGSCATKLAGLLRDARQDPQPASEPEQYDAASIDFDALPIGTVLKSRTGYYCTKGGTGTWWDSEEHRDSDDMRRATWLHPYTVVYQPAPLSPGECLRGLLAGRDDAEELLTEARDWDGVDDSVYERLVDVIGDAAREVHG